MSEWPPATDATTEWRVIRPRRGRRARVRRVALWGESVWIDVRARVFCTGCGEFVTVDELSKVDNSHRPGVPKVGGVLLLPMAPDGPEPRELSIMDVSF